MLRTEWLCKECFTFEELNDPERTKEWGETYWPSSSAEIRVCDECGQKTDCIPCEPMPNDF